MKTLVVASMFLAAFFGIADSPTAMACSYNQAASKMPSASEIVSANALVFVGVVTDVQEAEPSKRGQATFRIEVPIKGVQGKDSVKIENRGGGDCFFSFGLGERWFIAGDAAGASYFSGSIELAGPNDEDTAPPSEHEKALHKAFPQILKLPPLKAALPQKP
jgi:hypothetical protein